MKTKITIVLMLVCLGVSTLIWFSKGRQHEVNTTKDFVESIEKGVPEVSEEKVQEMSHKKNNIASHTANDMTLKLAEIQADPSIAEAHYKKINQNILKRYGALFTELGKEHSEIVEAALMTYHKDLFTAMVNQRKINIQDVKADLEMMLKENLPEEKFKAYQLYQSLLVSRH